MCRITQQYKTKQNLRRSSDKNQNESTAKFQLLFRSRYNIFFERCRFIGKKKIKQHTLSYVMYVYLSGTLKTTTNGREKIQKFSDFFIQHLYFMCQRYTFFYTQ